MGPEKQGLSRIFEDYQYSAACNTCNQPGTGKTGSSHLAIVLLLMALLLKE